MSQSDIADTTQAADPRFAPLYTLGAITALLSVVIMAVSVAAFIRWPYAAGTNSTEEIFALIQESLPGGLTALDAGLSLANLASIPLFLALYGALKRVNEAYALLALACGLVAVAAQFAARPVLEIFLFSELYAAASDPMMQNRILAAGDTLLMLFHGTAFRSYLLLSGISFLTSAWLMRGSPHFGRGMALLGLISYALGMGFILPRVGPFFAFVAMPGQAAWLVLLARTLRRLGRQGS